MKKVLVTFICLVFTGIAWAQKDSLQLDEGNNYVYYQVVEQKGLNADTLFNRAWEFAATYNQQAKPAKGTADNTLNTFGKFLIYTGNSVVRKEAGEVSYKLNVQTKDQKYRYRLSNFIFKPYQRDRYGNMTIVPGVEVPLEKLKDRYTGKDLNSFLNQIGSFCLITSSKIKQQISRQTPPAKKETLKKVSTTEDW